MAHEWNLRARSGACDVCHAEFAEGDTCYSVLRNVRPDLSGTFSFERVDRCRACWEKGEKDDLSGSWKTVYHAERPASAEAAPKQTVETVLRAQLEAGDEARPGVCYLLAVMLERKRVLIERDVRPGGAGERVHVYEHRKTGELLLVTDPGLELAELTDLQAEILRLLDTPVAPSPVPKQPDLPVDPAPPAPPRDETGPADG